MAGESVPIKGTLSFLKPVFYSVVWSLRSSL